MRPVDLDTVYAVDANREGHLMQAAEEWAPAPGRRSRVLVVDDEPQVLVALEDVLMRDYDVITAASPETALRVLEAERDVAVVMSDQRMPGMTGDELFSKISTSSDATRVMVTGYAELPAVIRAVNRGRIFAYVTKPWDSSELRLTIKKSVEHFELSRELAHERQLLDDLMNNIPDAIYFKDRDLRFTRMNRAAAERVALRDTSDAVGKRLVDLGIPPDLASAFEQEETQILARGHARIDLIREHEARDGRRYYSTTIAPVRARGGAVQGLVGISRDVTARVEVELALQRSNHVRTMLGAVNGAILRVKERDLLLQECCRIAVDEGGLLLASIVLVDHELAVECTVSHGADDELVQRLAHAAVDRAARSLLAAALSDRQPHVSSDPRSDLDGALARDLAERGGRALGAFPLVAEGHTLGVLVLVSDQYDFFDGEEVRLLSELADNVAFALDHLEKSARLDFLAYYDDLTGLPKRNLLVNRLLELVQPRSDSSGRVALVLVEVSRFRHVNATLGRGAGDDLLVQVGRRLAKLVAEADLLARFESSTFAILLAGAGDDAELAAWVERSVFGSFDAPFNVRSTELRVSVRIGIAVLPAGSTDADRLIVNAEAALANARASGQRYLFHAPHMNERVGEKLTLETRLRRALDHDQFLLYYQPKIDLKSGMVVGLEALIRWDDPERGLIAPAEFVPILEETGLIVEVGDWVLQSVAAQCATWLDEGLLPPRIAANVSATQLSQRTFVRSVEHAFELWPAARGGLDLEITESVLIEDLVGNIDKLRQLKEQGVCVAIDDFGTGYSSLGYLSRLPIDALKIDQSFVLRMSDDAQNMTIITTIISLAHSLDMKVIAEGVESSEQARLLKLVKCDQIQGFLVGKPQGAHEVRTLFRSNTRTWPPPA
jgi:diguanylate cyclase (GGDEF)-like protein/PAS domain S-box-containing protein